MPSFDVVNYSLRPSKSIQRQLVFESLATLQAHLPLEQLVYIGLGSIWFTDFILAHKNLKIDDMISIESSEVGYRRAVFNTPYSTVRVKEGLSSDILPTLASDPGIKSRPWCVWLDYDYEFNLSVKDDARWLIENAPANSVVLLTFNGHEMGYGAAPDRPGRLRDLFGDAVPDDLSKNACRGDRMQETLAEYAIAFLQSVAGDLGRPGGFIPAFRLVYRDGTPMITVGGVLPAKGAAKIASDVVEAPTWRSRPTKPIVAPHLTPKEAVILQSLLPCAVPITRDELQRLGFDLEDHQIETFQNYYKHYPSFAQIVS